MEAWGRALTSDPALIVLGSVLALCGSIFVSRLETLRSIRVSLLQETIPEIQRGLFPPEGFVDATQLDELVRHLEARCFLLSSSEQRMAKDLHALEKKRFGIAGFGIVSGPAAMPELRLKEQIRDDLAELESKMRRKVRPLRRR